MELTKQQMKALLMSRFMRRIAEGKVPSIHMLDKNTGKHIMLTPEEQLYHIQHDTPIGKELLKAEKQLMDELQRRI